MTAHHPALHQNLRLPSVDALLRQVSCVAAEARFGRAAVVAAARETLAGLRAAGTAGAIAVPPMADIATEVARRLEAADVRILRRVFNLTGTVLHTNLGRALLPEEAVAAAVEAMRSPVNLEYDLASGGRGERDDAVRGLLCELTGAPDALVVNNNAAAVLLALNTLACGKDAIVSRGELIEIGGSFRMPDIMARAGARLVEVGTTNRTHLKDYDSAAGPHSGLIMKVHTSNFLVQGFTAEVSPRDLAALARSRAIPFVDDLGSGTLIDLSAYGLRRERMVQDAVRDGADLITFSGDKLLGGPQAGFILGRRDLVRQCAANPMKRAMRLDKIRLAALEATLRLYRDPGRLAARLPTLAMLTRPLAALQAMAARLQGPLQAVLGDGFAVAAGACGSQIGSGALPLETIASCALAITPNGRKGAGGRLEALANDLRALPIPVIGRIASGALVLDLRTLDDEAAFAAQLGQRAAAAEGPRARA